MAELTYEPHILGPRLWVLSHSVVLASCLWSRKRASVWRRGCCQVGTCCFEIEASAWRLKPGASESKRYYRQDSAWEGFLGCLPTLSLFWGRESDCFVHWVSEQVSRTRFICVYIYSKQPYVNKTGNRDRRYGWKYRVSSIPLLLANTKAEVFRLSRSMASQAILFVHKKIN